MRSDKLPAMQFYPGDWRKDPAVQSLDYEARGVWFELLCIMWESEQRGKLVLNGRAMRDEEIARLLGLHVDRTKQILSNLQASGVAKLDRDTNVIFNSRMVRDAQLRDYRKAAGALGGSKTQANAKQKSTPSSSSSSSSSISVPKSDSSSGREPSRTTAARHAAAPAFEVPEELRTLPMYAADRRLCTRWTTLLRLWTTAYPAINVVEQVRRAHAWEAANPKRRKVDRAKFLNNWLAREQDRPRTQGNGQAGRESMF